MKIKLCMLFLFFINSVSAQRELWGTVSNGGQFGHGYIFKTDSIGDHLEIVHHFDSINGKNPGALLLASDNKLYGLTSAGGRNNQGLFSGGVFYTYDLTTSTFTVLQHFGANNTQITGIYPAGNGFRTLTEVSPGVIYGQIRGAYQGGVIFAFNSTTQTITTVLHLPTFQGGGSNTTLGNRLEGNLYLAPDGFLYGTTYTNSQCPVANPNFGSIIRIDPLTNAFSIRYLCPCNGNNGFQLDNHFAPHNDKLYSVTKFGGANNKGVIYAFDPASNSYVNKYNFQGGLLGWQPSTMVKATNGKFYGTADGGTPEPYLASGGGILFEFDPANDQFSKKLDFTYGNGFYMNVGPFPFSMINGHNGKLYGVTTNGIFEYNPDLNQTVAKGRFPVNMGWYSPATPSLTAVCRKPVSVLVNDTTANLCKGDDFSIDLQSDNVTSVTWKHNGIIDPSQTNSVLSFSGVDRNTAGVWIASLTNECGTITTKSIHLNIPSEIAVIESNLSLEVTSGGDHFQWIDCTTQTPVIGANNAIFSPIQNGSYGVEVTSGLCTDTSLCYDISTLATNPEILSDSRLTLYPNPVIDVLYLIGNIEIQSVVIYDAIGQMVAVYSYGQEMNISKLSQGLYSISVQTAKGVWKNKFVKE